MSNHKLYTEEEIVSFLKKEFADEINAETFMENLTPIELPSDREIEKLIGVEWWEGAKWMRDKIQGGNK